MALNRTLAWEVLRASCLMEISRTSHGLENTTFRENATRGKNISTKEFSKLHMKYGVVPCM